jgi:hypothetical protein
MSNGFLLSISCVKEVWENKCTKLKNTFTNICMLYIPCPESNHKLVLPLHQSFFLWGTLQDKGALIFSTLYNPMFNHAFVSHWNNQNSFYKKYVCFLLLFKERPQFPFVCRQVARHYHRLWSLEPAQNYLSTFCQYFFLYPLVLWENYLGG